MHKAITESILFCVKKQQQQQKQPKTKTSFVTALPELQSIY